MPGPQVDVAIGTSPWLGHSPHVAAEMGAGMLTRGVAPGTDASTKLLLSPFSWQLSLWPRVLFPQHCRGARDHNAVAEVSAWGKLSL